MSEIRSFTALFNPWVELINDTECEAEVEVEAKVLCHQRNFEISSISWRLLSIRPYRSEGPPNYGWRDVGLPREQVITEPSIQSVDRLAEEAIDREVVMYGKGRYFI